MIICLRPWYLQVLIFSDFTMCEKKILYPHTNDSNKLIIVINYKVNILKISLFAKLDTHKICFNSNSLK